MTDLSIIIVNYNTIKITLDCLKSIIKSTKGLNYEIILVDNASSDGSVDAIENFAKGKKNLKLKLVKSKKNLGFGKGNNLGIKFSKGRFILLLNTDTIVKGNIFSEMMNWMERHKEVGMSTCALKSLDGSIQETGGYFPNLLRVASWMFFLDDLPFVDRIIKPFHPMHAFSPFYKNTSIFQKKREMDWLTGAYMLIKREVIDEVGVFDKDYFMYTEDVDLCYRIKKAGWKIVYLPRWNILHLGGASSTKEFPIIKEYEGIITLYKNNMPKWQLPIVRVLLKMGAVIRIIVLGAFKGPEVIKIYAKAFKTV